MSLLCQNSQLSGVDALSLGGINIPRKVNTQKFSNWWWYLAIQDGKKNHVGMVLTVAWGSIQHTQRVGRYPLQLEVMLQIGTMPFSSCSQSCFYYYMSLGTVAYGIPGHGRSVLCVQSGFGLWNSLASLFRQVCNWAEWGLELKETFYPLSFLRVQDTVCRVWFSGVSLLVTAEPGYQVTHVESFLVFK